MFNNKQIFEKLNEFLSKKNLFNIVVVFLTGVLILIVSSFFTENQNQTTESNQPVTTEDSGEQAQTNTSSYEVEKKNELKNMLGKMKGVGKVDVMISFESGEELIPAVNITDGVSNTNEKDTEGGERNTAQTNKGSEVVMTTTNGDTQPMILKKNNPKVSGVMIVAEGANDKQVQLEIKNAVASLLNVQTNKVNVYPMQ